MANFIEKRLPESVRTKTSTLVAAALGLFLGLQYNDFFKSLFEKILPQTENLVIEAGVLIALTFVVVFISGLVGKALDGK